MHSKADTILLAHARQVSLATHQKLICRYTEICGFQGVFAGLLVGLKQIMPENDVTLLGYVKFRAKVPNAQS